MRHGANSSVECGSLAVCSTCEIDWHTYMEQPHGTTSSGGIRGVVAVSALHMIRACLVPAFPAGATYEETTTAVPSKGSKIDYCTFFWLISFPEKNLHFLSAQHPRTGYASRQTIKLLPCLLTRSRECSCSNTPDLPSSVSPATKASCTCRAVWWTSRAP